MPITLLTRPARRNTPWSRPRRYTNRFGVWRDENASSAFCHVLIVAGFVFITSRGNPVIDRLLAPIARPRRWPGADRTARRRRV